MDRITEQDRTLDSPAHAAWLAAAMKSDMPTTDLHAVCAARLRLLGAAAIANEVSGGQFSPELVTEVLRQIRSVADRPSHVNLYWPAE
ncbi:hypothetical protein [Corticimicrobacter populi]|uniref:hypothetical protein n=1 Tax=Corticimicrobacter populi TaxID=2175229 RepID=UPI0011B2275A|nr:hypothetical protein [Corticimicrobacter populi]